MSERNPTPGCRRCNAPKQPWQVYCGAACSVAWECGDRDPKAARSFENRSAR